MGWNITPQTIRQTVSNWLPKSTKSAQKSGSLAGRKISVTQGKATDGLKETKTHSLKPHRIGLSERQASTVWGKSLITLGIAKQAQKPEAPIYTSLTKTIHVAELKDTPKDTSELPRMYGDSMSSEVAEKMQLNVSQQKEGAGAFGEVRAAVPSGKYRSKPMRALKTTFNQNKSLEIELQSRLKHPNIASLKNAWRSEEVLQSTQGTGQAEAMEMEFIGQSLKDVITPDHKLKHLKPSEVSVPEALKALKSKEAEPLPPKLLKKVAAGTLNALHFMHYQEPPIIHFDVHPGNILVGGDGKAKITDFGCAKEHLPDGTFNGSNAFNAIYNGPEVWVTPRNLTAKTDMWALGCTLVEAATGESVCSMSPMIKSADERAEFIAQSAADALEHPALQTDENRDLKDLLSHLLDPNPDTRYSAKDAMQHAYFSSDRNN